MKCNVCGNTVSDNDLYCAECGNKIERANAGMAAPVTPEVATMPAVPASEPKKKKVNILLIVIILIILVGGAILAGTFFLLKQTDQIFCESSQGSITIYFDEEDGLIGYTTKGFTFDLDGQKKVAKQFGMEAYKKNFNQFFVTTYKGTCKVNGEAYVDPNPNEYSVTYGDYLFSVDTRWTLKENDYNAMTLVNNDETESISMLLMSGEGDVYAALKDKYDELPKSLEARGFESVKNANITDYAGLEMMTFDVQYDGEAVVLAFTKDPLNENYMYQIIISDTVLNYNHSLLNRAGEIIKSAKNIKEYGLGDE